MKNRWQSVPVRLAFGCVIFCASALAAKAQSGSLDLEVHGDPTGNRDAAATLVVFNQSDPESAQLAKFYAEKRGIPDSQILGLPCSTAEEISREEYDRTLAEPLRRAFTSNFWWKLRDADSPMGPVESNKIHFIALMRGIPLKVAQAADYPGDKANGPAPIGPNNSAAVDAELSVLGFHTRLISGALNNPYFRSYSPILDARHPELMLVCRLDGPSPNIVRRMILDGLAAEREGLAGFTYIDGRGITDGGLAEGDKWLLAAADTSRRHGFTVILDTGPEMFPEGYPMRNAAIYYGWYADQIGGAIKNPGHCFVRGAIAVHIHSFSATTVRDAQRQWVGPLLAGGAAATLGNVYEPYLTLTPHLDIFHDRLCAGLTFAEAAYMSQRVLSWMTTCVGDPLYRPFKGEELGAQLPATGEWATYRENAERWSGADRPAARAALKAAGRKLKSGVIFEGLGLLELTTNDRTAALAAFQQARQCYTNAEDINRVAIHEIIQLSNAQRQPDAVALARKMIDANPQSPAVPVFRIFDPQPATTPPPK